MRLGFPGGSEGKESAQQCRGPGFDPLVGKIPWRREWQPTSIFLPEEFHGQKSLAGYSPWGCRIRHDWVTNTFIFIFLSCTSRALLIIRIKKFFKTCWISTCLILYNIPLLCQTLPWVPWHQLTSLAVQWPRLSTPNAMDLGLIPGQIAHDLTCHD